MERGKTRKNESQTAMAPAHTVGLGVPLERSLSSSGVDGINLPSWQLGRHIAAWGRSMTLSIPGNTTSFEYHVHVTFIFLLEKNSR